jgi:hypothetical protein
MHHKIKNAPNIGCPRTYLKLSYWNSTSLGNTNIRE